VALGEVIRLFGYMPSTVAYHYNCVIICDGRPTPHVMAHAAIYWYVGMSFLQWCHIMLFSFLLGLLGSFVKGCVKLKNGLVTLVPLVL
jgi:hypothetical protein